MRKDLLAVIAGFRVPELIQASPSETMSKLMERLFGLYQTREAQVKVVNAGMVKAGKSSLLNALVERQDYFATGAVRTTVENQAIDFHDYELIDTPGINADEEDTEEAVRAYGLADLLLFTHNAVDGELTSPQLHLLEKLKALFPSDDSFWQRTLFVLTNAGQKEREEIEEIVRVVGGQLEQSFGRQPDKMYSVDSVTYWKAATEQKPRLMEASGIHSLLVAIDERAEWANGEKAAYLQERLAFVAGQCVAELQSGAYAVADSNDGQAVAGSAKQVERLAKLHARVTADVKKLLDELKARSQKGAEMKKYTIELDSSDTESSYRYSSRTEAGDEGTTRFGRDVMEPAIEELEEIHEKQMAEVRAHQEYRAVSQNPYHALLAPVESALDSWKKEWVSVAAGGNVMEFALETSFKLRPGAVNADASQAKRLIKDVKHWGHYRPSIIIDSQTKTVKGIFWDSEVEKYSYDYYPMIGKFRERLNEVMGDATKYLKECIDAAYRPFANQLFEQFNARAQGFLRHLEREEERLTEQRAAREAELASKTQLKPEMAAFLQALHKIVMD